MNFKVIKPKAINESLDRKSQLVKDYRKLANLGDEEVITESNLDNWALNATSTRNRTSVEDIKKALLTEDVTIKQAAQDLEAENVVKSNGPKGQIELALDRALTLAKRKVKHGQKGDYPNILFIGEAGTGKSSVVRKWAQDNNINLFEVRCAGMDSTDLGGALAPSKDNTVAVRLASTEFDKLERPNSVLFLDEYNRAPSEVRTNLLELVNSHVLPDSRESSGQRFLPNFLFTIAAINPPSGDYDVKPMDDAETSRFRSIQIQFDPLYLNKYLQKYFDDLIANSEDDEEEMREYQGKKKLADAILTNKKFEFDSREDMLKGKEQLDFDYKPLNYRSFTELLNYSDGTKEDFLNLWSDYVNPLKKNMIKDVLNTYKDIDDKANDVLKDKSESPVFNKKESDASKIRSALGI